jgi:hypothetical protein
MDLDIILRGLGGLAAKLAPSIIPGAGPAIAAARAIGNAFETVKAANGGQAPADAEAQHDALLARVKAHADSTLGRLEGR